MNKVWLYRTQTFNLITEEVCLFNLTGNVFIDEGVFFRMFKIINSYY